MEIETVNSLKIFDYQQENIDSIEKEFKFKRISGKNIENCDTKNLVNIFKDTVKQCEGLNEHIFEIERFNHPESYLHQESYFYKSDLEEPSRPEIKVRINVEKSPSLSRSKSEHESLIIEKRLHSAVGRSKVHTATRFSNLSTNNHENSTTKESQADLINFQNNYLTNHSNQNAGIEEKVIKNTLNKRIRIKSSSVVSLSAKLNEEKKFKKCIPLKEFQGKEPESFFENAYRVKREHSSLWNSNAKNRNSSDHFKRTNIRLTMNPKEMKKIVFQGYDFDGELIPSFYASQKQKKSTEENQNIEIEPLDDFKTENLKNYNERNKKNQKTLKQVRFQYSELNEGESEFLKNFKNLEWNQNIEEVELQENEKMKGSTNALKEKKFKNFSPKTKAEKEQNQIESQDKKKTHQEQLISEFEKIKNGEIEKKNEEANNNFQLGFSKYIKAKEFHSKESKSKSYNYQSFKYLPIEHENRNEDDFASKIKQSPKKGPEKIRANKRLFKQIFNTSLKNIHPENREDIATIKLIKDTEKENEKIENTEKERRNPKLKLTRNSDTVMLQKGFEIQTNFLNEFGKISKSQSSNFSKKSSEKRQIEENEENQSYCSINEDSIQESNDERFSELSSISQKKVKFSTGRNSFNNLIGNNDVNSLQKMFKKETNKILFKHTLNESKKQNFQ